MSKSKKSTRSTRPIEIKVWSGFQHDDADPIQRIATVQTGPTVADVSDAVLRAMRITKAQEKAVKFGVWESIGPTCRETRIHAVLKDTAGRKIRQAMTAPISSLEGAHVESAALWVFLSHFTDRNVFTSTRDQVVFHYASRTAKEKREGGLVAAYNRLPARQQRELLKALRVGPAVVLQARGAR